MYRAVIFDLYGTLLVYGDMAKAWTAWIRDVRMALDALNIRVDEELLRVRCNGFFSRSVDRVAGLAVYESRLHRLAAELGGVPDLEWCRLTAEKSMNGWQQEVLPDPDALPLLRVLRQKNIRCALLTNFDYPAHVHRLLEQFGFSDYLDVVVISGEEELKKPDERIFALARERLGVSSAEILFVGDHPEQDIAGALRCRMGAALIRRGEGLLHEQIDFHAASAPESVEVGVFRVPVVENLPQLLSLLG